MIVFKVIQSESSLTRYFLIRYDRCTLFLRCIPALFQLGFHAGVFEIFGLHKFELGWNWWVQAQGRHFRL